MLGLYTSAGAALHLEELLVLVDARQVVCMRFELCQQVVQLIQHCRRGAALVQEHLVACCLTQLSHLLGNTLSLCTVRRHTHARTH